MSNNTYTGGWVFGEQHSEMNIAALKWDGWYRRWEGNLHFPAGLYRVYLQENHDMGTNIRIPAWWIMSVQGGHRVGQLFRQFQVNKPMYYGRLYTGEALGLETYIVNRDEQSRRFVIFATAQPIKPTSYKQVVTLDLAPYPDGQAWECKPRRSEYQAMKRRAESQGYR